MNAHELGALRSLRIATMGIAIGLNEKNAPGVVAAVFGVFVCSGEPAKAVEGHTHSKTLARSPHAPFELNIFSFF